MTQTREFENPYAGIPVNQPNDEGCQRCKDWFMPWTGWCRYCKAHDSWRPVSQAQVAAYTDYQLASNVTQESVDSFVFDYVNARQPDLVAEALEAYSARAEEYKKLRFDSYETLTAKYHEE